MKKGLFDDFAAGAYQSYDLTALNINPSEALKNWFLEEIQASWDLNKDTTKEWRHDFFKIDKAEIEDWGTFLHDFEGFKAMYGIRHFNGNKKEPFVHVLLSNYDNLENKLPLVKEVIENRLAVFQPKQLFLYLSPSMAEKLHCSYNHYQATWAARITRIKAASLPPNYKKIRLQLVDQDNYYDQYLDYYKQFHHEQPDKKDKVAVNDKATMEISRTDGLLYQILLNEKPIGLIAGERLDFMGASGLYFNEIVIDQAHKGNKLAAAAQRHLIEKTNTIEFVWGTIDTSNIASSKTAARVGRKVCRIEVGVGV